MTKKRKLSKKSVRVKQSTSFSWVVKLFRFLSILLLAGVGLGVILMGSIWVAGPYLFSLEDTSNILLISSKINDEKGKIYLTYFFPNTKEIEVVALASDPVSVLGGYGEYELQNVNPLLSLEKKKLDFRLAALSWGTHTLLDRVVETSSNLKLETKKDLQKQLRASAFSQAMNPQDFIELAQLFFFTRSVPVEQISIKTQPTSLAKLDILDNVVLYEDCSIAVVNTSEKIGLAGQMSHLLEKNGAVVVRVTDQSSPYQLSTFSFSQDDVSCQQLANRLQVLFPGEIVKQENQELQQEYRADLVIFIGKDLASLL